MSEIKDYEAIMWAEMKPDIYANDTGKDDENGDPIFGDLKPGWSCYAQGDMDGELGLEDLELRAERFPPGTKITVEVPICPKCEESNADYAHNYDTGQVGKCECGFDWRHWALGKYS